jgi:hypothetical protein
MELGESPRTLEVAVSATVAPRQVGAWVRVYPSAHAVLNAYYGLTAADPDYFTPVTLPTGSTDLNGAAKFLLLTPERLALLAEAGQGPQPSNTDTVPDGYQGRAYTSRFVWSELAAFVERQADQSQGNVWRWRAVTDLDHSRGMTA